MAFGDPPDNALGSGKKPGIFLVAENHCRH
jgi:hypothetical protein